MACPACPPFSAMISEAPSAKSCPMLVAHLDKVVRPALPAHMHGGSAATAAAGSEAAAPAPQPAAQVSAHGPCCGFLSTCACKLQPPPAAPPVQTEGGRLPASQHHLPPHGLCSAALVLDSPQIDLGADLASRRSDRHDGSSHTHPHTNTGQAAGGGHGCPDGEHR